MRLSGSSDFPTPSRILVTQLRRIGDVLLCSPAIRALARHFPSAQIDFMAESPAEEVLRGNPNIHMIHVPPARDKYSSLPKFVGQLRRQKYDWAIDFFSNPRSAQLVFFSGARLRVGLDRFGRRWAYTHRVVEEENDRSLYAADLRLKIVQNLGVPDSGRELEIFSDKADAAEADRAFRILESLDSSRIVVALATGNVNPAKLYPPEFVAALINMFLKEGFEVLVTSGPGEDDLTTQALSRLPQSVLHLANARAASLAALYRRANIYVGPDSAPKHIATACGLPTVAFFGAGRPANWHDPFNPCDVLLEAPCDLRPHCTGTDCAHRQCLRKILPEEIFRAALHLLAK